MNKLPIHMLIMISVIVLVSATVVYGNSTDRDLCQGQFYWDINCYTIMIEQNDDIIKKLDWNNCVILAKESKHYNPHEEFIFVNQTPEDLIRTCGDIP